MICILEPTTSTTENCRVPAAHDDVEMRRSTRTIGSWPPSSASSTEISFVGIIIGRKMYHGSESSRNVLFVAGKISTEFFVSYVGTAGMEERNDENRLLIRMSVFSSIKPAGAK